MRIVYSPAYHVDLGAHIFPTLKYQRLYERIVSAHPEVEVLTPAPASWDDLALVHTAEYLAKLQTGRFTVNELAELELPWSPAIVEGFRLMTGGTLAAATASLPLSFHLGGGFHHAFANHGEGFCLFNDVAVAIRVLWREDPRLRAAIVDLDVHHGNGTAFIFEGEPRVFTFSMHQQHNYPAFKPRGSLDIGLADGVGDDRYLAQLAPALEEVFAHEPRMVFYLAGADPYEDDHLGGLALSKAGLAERDRMVLRGCVQHGVPVVILLAGGYARRVEDTVDIHYATFVAAAEL